jgi:hypothetical protein
MDHNVKIMTHESIVHGQISSIEGLLERPVNFAVTLNVKGVRSHIRFVASNEEIEKVKSNLGYKIYVQLDKEWVVASDDL